MCTYNGRESIGDAFSSSGDWLFSDETRIRLQGDDRGKKLSKSKFSPT